MKTIDVSTRDGSCPVHVHTPAGSGQWPGILMFMDGPGMRPTIQELAERLAEAGFAVVLPDLFYRSGAYAPIDPRHVWSDAVLREAHRQKFMARVTAEGAMSDTAAFLAFMDQSPDVVKGMIGIVGYCMGGRLALIAAGTYPERIAVAASYHGGGLANDTPSSPHLLARSMKARIYVAGAVEDPNFDDATKLRLEDALRLAGVEHVVETYPARHGWVPRDTLAHDAVEAEHHWRTLIPLMDSGLKS